MGLALLLAAFFGVAFRWAGSRLTGIETSADDRAFVAVRRLAPVGGAIALLVFVVLGMARCAR